MGEKSAVLLLQEDALNREVAVGDLLRRAYVVAKKLNLSEFEAWVAKELNGYEPSDRLPEYRIAYGQVRGWNPYRGWIPVVFESPEEESIASKRGIGQSVAELEKLLERHQPGGQLHIPLGHENQRALSASAGFDTHFSAFIAYTAVDRV